jgi:hypothetical protein
VILACLALAVALGRGPEAAAQGVPVQRAPAGDSKAPAAPAGGGKAAAEVKAQGDDEVDALVQRAQKAFDKGRFEDALIQLALAWEQRQSYDIAGNLGIVELKLGRVRDAADHLEFALRYFPPTEGASLKAGLQAKLDEARSQVGAVLLRVEPPDAEVLVNGRRVEPGLLGREVFVGAGAVTIVVRREGYLQEQRTLTVEKGGQLDQAIALRKVPPPPPPPVPPPPPPPPRWPAVVLGAVGVVGLGVGTGLVVAGGGEGSEAETLHDALVAERKSCVAGAGNYDGVRCPTLDDTARRGDSLHDAGIGLLIGGGVALVSSGGYLLWREREKKLQAPAVGLQVAPWVGVAGVGFLAAGSF